MNQFFLCSPTETEFGEITKEAEVYRFATEDELVSFLDTNSDLDFSLWVLIFGQEISFKVENSVTITVDNVVKPS